MLSRGLSGRIAEFARHVGLALDDRRRRRALGRELAELESRHMLDASLEDVGLSRAQVPALLRAFPRRQRLFRRMLARLRIAPSRIADRTALNELIWTCTVCAADKRCRAWLDSGQTGGYAEFCPNATAFEKLRRQPRRAASA